MKRLRILQLGFAACALLASSFRLLAAEGGLPPIDFVEVFPHLFWVSSVGRDREYPAGFQYKLLSVRRDKGQTVELILMRQTEDEKTIVMHMKGPAEKFERDGAGMTERFGKKLNVTFEQFDFRDVRTAEEFEGRAKALGWDTKNVSP